MSTLSTANHIRPEHEGIELRARLRLAVDRFKIDRNELPIGESFEPVALSTELPFIRSKELAEILTVVDQWAEPTFWERSDIAARHTASGPAWAQFKNIRAMILAERPDVLFYIGEDIRNGENEERGLKLLIDSASNSIANPHTTNAARRALSVLVVSENLLLSDLPSDVSVAVKSQIEKLHFSKHFGDVKKPSHPSILMLLESHPTKLDSGFYQDIASNNAKLTEAYAQLRSRLHDPSTNIENRIELFEKYLALNQGLVDLLPKKGDAHLELDLMFLLANPDISREIAEQSAVAGVLGSHQMAIAIRHQLGSDYFREEALEFLVLAGTLAPDGVPVRTELLASLVANEASLEDACAIAEKHFGDRAAQGLKKDVERIRETGTSELYSGPISLFQLGELNRGKFEAIPLKIFHPTDKQIVDGAVEAVYRILASSDFPELSEGFLERAAKQVERLRKYVARMSDKQLKDWAKPLPLVSVEIAKKAWVMSQLAQRCIKGEQEPSDHFKKAMGRWFAASYLNLVTSPSEFGREVSRKTSKVYANFIGVQLKKAPNPFERLFAKNVTTAVEGHWGSETPSEVLRSWNPEDVKLSRYSDFFTAKRLRLSTDGLGLYFFGHTYLPATEIHFENNRIFAKVRSGAPGAQSSYLFDLLRLDRVPDIVEAKWAIEHLGMRGRYFRNRDGTITSLVDGKASLVNYAGEPLIRCSKVFTNRSGDTSYAFAEYKGRAFIWELNEGGPSPRTSALNADRSFGEVHFSADGRRVFAHYNNDVGHGQLLDLNSDSRDPVDFGPNNSVTGFFFGGKEGNTPVALVASTAGGPARVINVDSEEEIGVKKARKATLLSNSSNRFKVINFVTALDHPADRFDAVLDTKTLSFVGPFASSPQLNGKTVVESMSGESFYFSYHDGRVSRSSRHYDWGDISSLSFIKIVSRPSTLLDMKRELLMKLLREFKDVRYAALDFKSGDLYVVETPITIDRESSWGVSVVSADGSSFRRLDKDSRIREVYPVPNSDVVYALGLNPESSFRKKDFFLKELGPKGKVKVEFKFDDVAEPIFSLDGKSQYLIVQKKSGSFVIHDLVSGTTLGDSASPIEKLYEPQIAPDGSSCFIRSVNYKGEVEIFVLWWYDKGIEGLSKEQIEERCRPKLSRDLRYTNAAETQAP